MRFTSLCAFALVIGGGGVASHAAPIVLDSLSADGRVNDLGVIDTTLINMRVGTGGGGSAGGGASAIFVFQLPELDPDHAVTGASFSFRYDSFRGPFGDPPRGGDLYGLDWRETADLLAADHHNGPEFDDRSGVVLLQDDILNGDVPEYSRVSASDGGGNALAEYLNRQYETGGTGQYVFLRLSYDGVFNINSTRGYAVSFVEDTRNGVFPIPQLTFETAVIPEPTAIAMMGSASLLLLRRGRQERRQ